MKIEEIHDAWSKDCEIGDDYTEASRNIPKLHNKYLKMLSAERKLFKTLLEHKKTVTMKITDYYNGKINAKDIGRDPWQQEESRESRMQRIDSDKELIELNLKIAAQEEKLLVLKEIVNSINQRNFIIKNAIDWHKWHNGNGLL